MGKNQRTNFIDCGAHKGQSIIHARKLFGNDINIYSFEPVPFFANWLSNFYINDDKITIYNQAVWDKNKNKTFHLSKSKATWGSSLINRFDENDTILLDVECINFSKWVTNNLNNSDYNILKLDIEGAECKVLNKLMDDNTLSYFNYLVGEWHDNHSGYDNSEFIKTRNRLKQEYNTEMVIWEAPWYDEKSTPGMVSMDKTINDTQTWGTWGNKKNILG